MGKTLSVLVSVGMSPGVLEWTGLLTVAQPRSGSQHPGTGQQQQQQQQQPGLLFLLLQDPGLSSAQLKCFCTLLLKNSIKKKKSPSDTLSGPSCAVLGSKYSLASIE